MKSLFSVFAALILTAVMTVPASAGVVRGTAKATAKTASFAYHMSPAKAVRGVAKGTEVTVKSSAHAVKWFATHVIW